MTGLGFFGSRVAAATNPFTGTATVTYDHTKVFNSDKTNFPVLFSGVFPNLRTVANGGSVTNSSGFDIVFTSDVGGSSVLPFQLDPSAPYNATTGAFTAWVLLPSLSHTVDTVFYVQYGNASITTSQEDQATTWAGYFTGYHCEQAAGTTTVTQSNDFSASGNDLNFSGSAYPAPVAAQIGGGLDFGTSNNSKSLNRATITGLPTGTTPFTFSAWVKSYGTQGGGIAGYGPNGPTGQRVLFYQDNNDLLFDFDNCGARCVNGLADTNWHYITGTLPVGATTAGQALANIDGNPITPTYYSGSQTLNITLTTISVGHIADAFANYWSGQVDEVRFGPPRDDDWIKTEYFNQLSPGTTYTATFGNDAYDTVILSQGPLLYYPMGAELTSTSTVAPDFSGNGLDGTLTGELTQAAYQNATNLLPLVPSATALAWAQYDNKHIAFPNTTRISNLNRDVSFSDWVYINQRPDDGYGYIVQCALNGLCLGIGNLNTLGPGAWQAFFGKSNISNDGFFNTPLYPGSWYHLVLTIDPSGNYAFWVNGIKDTATGTTSVNYTGSAIGRIGNNGQTNAGQFGGTLILPSDPFSASMEKFVIFNRKLTDAEIAAQFAAGSGPGQYFNIADTGLPLLSRTKGLLNNEVLSPSSAWRSARSILTASTDKRIYAIQPQTTSNGQGDPLSGWATASAPLNNYCGSDSNGWGIQAANQTGHGNLYHSGSANPNSGVGAINFHAYDGATGKIWLGTIDATAGSSVVWFDSLGGNTGNPAAGTNPTFTVPPSTVLYAMCSQFWGGNGSTMLIKAADIAALSTGTVVPSGFTGLGD